MNNILVRICSVCGDFDDIAAIRSSNVPLIDVPATDRGRALTKAYKGVSLRYIAFLA